MAEDEVTDRFGGIRPSVRERVLAMPAGKRRLLGVVGVLVGVLVIAVGLGSIDGGSEDVPDPEPTVTASTAG